MRDILFIRTLMIYKYKINIEYLNLNRISKIGSNSLKNNLISFLIIQFETSSTKTLSWYKKMYTRNIFANLKNMFETIFIAFN